MYEHLDGMLRFLETGGPVLWPIGVTAFALGAVIIERYWYFQLDFPHRMARQVDQWKDRLDHSSPFRGGQPPGSGPLTQACVPRGWPQT